MTPVSPFFKKVFLVIAISMLGFFVYLQQWRSSKIIEWDVTLYYSYLPATFIYDDIEFDDPNPIWDEALFFMNVDEAGNRYVKMTSGLSYLYAPFFFGAHAFAMLDDSVEANGFTAPYRFGLLLSDLTFALLGLWFLGRLLLRWFNDISVLIALLIIFLGTNMAYYTYVSPMSHVYSFALVSMILYWFFKYLDDQRWRYVIPLGIACGLMILIRPTNIITLLLPLIALINQRSRINFKTFFLHLAMAMGIAFLICLPQLWYWHHMTGHWIIYSYNEESFFFTDPEIWKGLFSYRKGWLIYSPVLIFAFLGFFFMKKQPKWLVYGNFLTVAIALWITFSWWCWWYGGGFSARALIEFLPFMAFPLAAFLEWSLKRKWMVQLPIYLVIGYFCFTSVFMSFQYTHGIIHFDAMSKTLFWKQYLVGHYLKDYNEHLDPPDYDAALKNEE